ncbi:putative heterokaryon incompatibility protein [Botrytis fragariae]|uniref:Putative heterokaryon incompatibility protein n=1 Tax=Botrytis fragariae TaxID=1964551 RepID=A0A8H6AU70_9HELO|nr:putative heterokaryon incompatibility protein [Botrytis fragariae]KAF5873565.1 putative heterokaryon incompatibility protein [Botrytis fragariae]
MNFLDPLNISIYATPLGNSPQYSALSYTWGDKTHVIPIADYNRKFLHHVTENLESALRHLRRQKEAIILWIDALCINQDDDREKSQQVIRKDSPDSDKAMDIVHQITDLGTLDNTATDSSNIGQWKAFVSLMRRPWFSRRWTIQEVVFARNAFVHCGRKEVRWRDFADAVTLFGEKAEKIRTLFESTKNGSQYLINSQNSPARSFITAAEPRDTIYALIALANDVVPPMKEKIDYRKSVATVCKSLISQVADTHGTLDLICRSWAPMEHQLPSWIPPYTGPSFSWDPKCVFRRIKAVSLIGPPDKPFYNASGRHRQAGVKFDENGLGFIVEVQGFEFDRVRLVEEPARDGYVPKSWLDIALGLANENEPRLAEAYTPTRNAIPDMFWRTIVSDRNSKGNSPPDWYLRACKESYRLSSTKGLDAAVNSVSPEDYDALNTVKISEKGDNLRSPTMVTSFLNRVQAVIWNRRMAVTEQDALAMVPCEAQDGDRICIIFGCSIPVILREHGEDVWKVIGECYLNVSEIMGGEIADNVDKGYKVDSFNLI